MVLCIACLAVVGYAAEQAPKPDKDTLMKEWSTISARLPGQTNQIILAVNGLCCRSCAIGIGKKVCTLDFVDTNSLPRGVKVDRKNSLLTVSVKDAEAIDPESLTRAIRKAGYDPVRLYRRTADGELTVTDIPAAE